MSEWNSWRTYVSFTPAKKVTSTVPTVKDNKLALGAGFGKSSPISLPTTKVTSELDASVGQSKSIFAKTPKVTFTTPKDQAKQSERVLAQAANIIPLGNYDPTSKSLSTMGVAGEETDAEGGRKGRRGRPRLSDEAKAQRAYDRRQAKSAPAGATSSDTSGEQTDGSKFQRNLPKRAQVARSAEDNAVQRRARLAEARLAKSETGKGTETGTEADTEGTSPSQRKKRKAKPTPVPSASANEGTSGPEGDEFSGGKMTQGAFDALDKKQLKGIAKAHFIRITKEDGKGEKTVEELKAALVREGAVKIKKSKK
jgi:hypothetical protein